MSETHLEASDLIRIPGGEFPMGQENGRDDERPVHRVTVAPFLLCRFQATNAHWEAFRKATGREKVEFAHETAPAASVNWFDAMAYCRWLSAEWGQARAPAHRSRMGIRGARRGGGEALSLGR